MTTLHEHPSAPSAINLAVGGMTCAGCASNIQRGLAQLPGVDDAVVNLATRRATVNPDGSVDAEVLEGSMRAAITGLGYEVLTPAAAPAGGAHGDHAQHGDRRDEFDEHAAHVHADSSRIADYRRRFYAALVLSVPLLAISMIPALQFDGWEWLALVLATPVVFYSGWPFHRSAVKGLRHRAVNMDTLVSLGTVAAWAWSAVALVANLDAHVYFETGAVIVTLILLGKWIEVRSTARAGDAIRALSARQSATAVLEDGTVVSRDELVVGTRFVVKPGETIATDGVVVAGAAAVDSALVTGEPVPVAARQGTEVIGGTIATDGSLTVEATRVGSETMLAQVARMVDDALSGRARLQRLADRISSVFVPAVIAVSLLTLVGWLLATSDPSSAFQAAVAVLIISCPCALGLATPLAIMVGTGRGAQLGILVRGPQALEDARDLTTVVFDKTGTLTEGRMAVTATSPGADTAVLDAAGAVEARSEHPVAAAIAASRPRRPLVKDFRSIPGQGVSAMVQGLEPRAEVTVGSRRLFDGLTDALVAWAAERERLGETVVFVGRREPLGGGLLGGGPLGGATMTRPTLLAEAAIALADTVKEGAAPAVANLRAQGIEVVLLTGDNESAAAAVGRVLGIDRVIAGVLPGGKADVIRELQAPTPQTGARRVAMVGDGVNDAPALAMADLGIALGTGADVAREASDVTIVRGDPGAVADAIALSRSTVGVLRGNLFWAFAYNVAAIPLAVFGVLNPMIAAAAMGGSSLFVVGNSLRLRRAVPHHNAAPARPEQPAGLPEAEFRPV